MKNNLHFVFSTLFTIMITFMVTAQPSDFLTLLFTNGVINPNSYAPVGNFNFELFGANTRKQTTENWVNNAWRNEFQVTRTHSTDCRRKLSVKNFGWDTVSRSFINLFSSDTFIYDASNRLIKNITTSGSNTFTTSYSYVGTRPQPDTITETQSFGSQYRNLYAYNALNYITTDVYQIRSSTTVPYENSYRKTYTYNSNNLLIQYLKEDWRDNAWSFSEKEIYTYNSSNRITQTLNISNPSDSTKFDYTYNTQNRLSNMVGSSWSNQRWNQIGSLNVTSFNAKNRPLTVEFSDIRPSFGRYDFAYYTTGDTLLRQFTEQYRQTTTNPWVYDFRSTFEYCGQAPNVAVETISIGDIKLMPNPVTYQLNIQLSDPSVTVHQLSIYDIAGHIILSKISNSATTTLDIANLPTGLYLLKIETTDGRRGIQKFVKQ
ncbi:MAG: T9SS type A sorting domain-containing protein [Saprospiraceae bacterium]|nr:T9SS type A sorting domain-containing protein [Saprospiraceae bacterium]